MGKQGAPDLRTFMDVRVWLQRSTVTQTLNEWGWDDEWAARLEQLSLEAQPARVTLQQRDRWEIQTEDGPRSARLPATAHSGLISVTGDWIACIPGPSETDPWSILRILPRRSVVRRGAAGESRSEQVLAANVDRLWIVQALDTPPNLRSLERYLAVAWESGASPEIVLTKSDLAEGLSDAVEQVQGVAFGVPIWVTSVTDSASLDAVLARELPWRCSDPLGLANHPW